MRGPKPINPLLVSQEGKPGCSLYLFWISLFSPLFNMRIQECNWSFKEAGLPFAAEGDSWLPSVLKKKGPFAAAARPPALCPPDPPALSQGPQRPGLSSLRTGGGGVAVGVGGRGGSRGLRSRDRPGGP